MGQQTEQATTDWYERRDDLCGGMVFRTHDGPIVKLDRTVPGDGTKWYAATWSDYSNGWTYDDYTIEPGDLTGEPADSATALAASEAR